MKSAPPVQKDGPRINEEIRSREVQLIDHTGANKGVVDFQTAMSMAAAAGLDLVEIVPTAVPPVCKIINFGKFRYDQTKREKESKKSQHQVKVKEVKLSANISTHDLSVKIRHAKEFLEDGNKVKITCAFRGREIMHPEKGNKMMAQVILDLDEVSMVEAAPKLFGKFLNMVLAPCSKKKKPGQ